MMSAPVHRDDETDGFRLYAPPGIRDPAAAKSLAGNPLATPSRSGDKQTPGPSAHAPEAVVSQPADWTEDAAAEALQRAAAVARRQAASLPRMATGVGGPNIQSTSASPALPQVAHVKFSPVVPPVQTAEDEWPASVRCPRFEGDIAIKALRQRMSLRPDFVPTPPAPVRKRNVQPWLSWLTFGAGTAAVAGLGIIWTMQPAPRLTAPKDDRSISVVKPNPAEPQLASVTIAVGPSVRLLVEDREAFTNEALPLGVSLKGATGEEVLLLNGLISGARLSVGAPFGTSGWRLPVREVTQALAYAPKDFVGVMELVVDLRTEDGVRVDSQPVRLAWLPKPSIVSRQESRLEPKQAEQPTVTASLDPAEIATLMRRGDAYLRTGDIAAARLVFRRAANAGHWQAALALGATYDPVVLADLGVLGFPPDIAQARSWYDKAARLGSDEAVRRIDRLARAHD